MKLFALLVTAIALVIGGGCFYPYHYTQMTGAVSFPAKDHVLNLTAVSFERNTQNEWVRANGRPVDFPDPDSRDADGFALWAEYGKKPTDPEPTTFVISRIEASLNGKVVKDLVPLVVATNAWHPLERYVVPGDADFSGKASTRLKSGTYVLKVHYQLDGREYDATFKLIYSHGLGFTRWGIIC
jgi:hypothetical protein